MSEGAAPSVEAAVLGQLLLMQSVLCGLPDERSLMGFTCRGLSFLPGVGRVSHVANDAAIAPGASARFPLGGRAGAWGELMVELTAPEQFASYEPYVRNFAAMVALILDERAQRLMNLRHSEQLETSVQDRTRQLTQEIAERQVIEEQLSRSRDMLALTLDSVPQAIFWKDRDGRYLGCNRPFALAAGLADTAAIIGKTDAELPWRAEDVPGYRECDRRVLTTGQPERRVLEQVRRADGSVRSVETTKVPLVDASGQPYGVLGVFDDVTEQLLAADERESLQRQLAQAQKMESIGRLAGGVAHDFNNMLQAILGNASLALIVPGLAPAVREHLEEVLKAAERSASLTQQLLAFARKQAVTPKVLDLNRTVASMLKMLQRLIGEDIHLEWQPAPDLWPVCVDPVQIDQVLANLVVNARDAINGVGVVKIATGQVLVGGTDARVPGDVPPGEYVTLTVSDSGAGMTSEVRAHLFEPFFTTKPAGRGTGLGLATVYGIVQQNNGAITVGSEPGHGSAFTVFLPRAGATVTPDAAPGQGGAPLRGSETILLVEDEEQILTLTRRILEQIGYRVLAAGQPEHAIRIVRSHAGPIDLLITDVIMPGMNGRVLLEEVRRLQPSIRCLFISGYAADVLPPDPRGEDGAQFQPKPFTAAELAQRVRRVLDRAATTGSARC